MSNREKIKIICRIRPFLKHEADDQVVHVTDNNTITLENKRDPTRPFIYKSFSSCYAPDATQENIFTQDVLPLIERVFQGYSASVFTYGITGTGKSYSLVGTKDDPGIIPRVAKFLFETKQASQVSSISITMSYMEILKESVFDMLVPNHKDISLDIREDSDRNVFVANLKKARIETYGDFSKLFNMANKNRATASTKLNSRSSRSHAILTFDVKTVTPIESEQQQHEDVVVGTINLIDLAGSEDNRKSGNGKARMTESAAINKSLFVLGQVVEALNTGATRIPFRDSKLTRILQSTLGGTSLGMMIINIAPGHSFINDTTNTLNFASRTREIKNAPKINNIRRTKPISPKIIHDDENAVRPTRRTPPRPPPSMPAAVFTTKRPTLLSRRISTHLNNNNNKRSFSTYEEMEGSPLPSQQSPSTPAAAFATKRPTLLSRRISTHPDINNNKRSFSTYEEMERNSKRSKYHTHELSPKYRNTNRLSLQHNSMPSKYRANTSITSSTNYHDTTNRRRRRSFIHASSSMQRLEQWLEEIPLQENLTHHTTTTNDINHPSATRYQHSPTRTSNLESNNEGVTGGQDDDDNEMVMISKADLGRIYDQLMTQAREQVEASRYGPNGLV